MKTKHDNCDFCEGRVIERQVTVDLRYKGRLFVFENVPVGVCRKCGERYYRGTVLERLEELASHQRLFKKKIQVPLVDFAEAADS
jgi:YgiT-type zinc finger domain-containing protein